MDNGSSVQSAGWDQFSNYKLKTVDVDLSPEFVGIARLRELTGIERDEVEDKFAQSKDKKSITGLLAFIVSKCWIDESGKHVQPNPALVNQLPARLISKLVGPAQKLSGLTAEDVEQLAKN